MFIYSIHIMDEWNFLSIRFLPSCQTEPVASAYNKGGRLTKDWAEVRPSRRLPRRVASTGKGYLLLQHTYTRVVSLARLERLERIKERRATSAYHSRFSLRRLIGTRAPSPSPSKPASAALCSTCCWPTAGNWVGARVKSSRRGRERRVARRGGALPGAQAAGSLKEEENAGTSDSVRSMSELFSSVRFSEERFSSSPSSLKTLTSSSLPRSSPPPLLLTCGILRISLSLSLSLCPSLYHSLSLPLFIFRVPGTRALAALSAALSVGGCPAEWRPPRPGAARARFLALLRLLGRQRDRAISARGPAPRRARAPGHPACARPLLLLPLPLRSCSGSWALLRARWTAMVGERAREALRGGSPLTAAAGGVAKPRARASAAGGSPTRGPIAPARRSSLSLSHARYLARRRRAAP